MAEKKATEVAPLTFDNKKSYGKDYFSGANVKIFFGSILIDEITSLEYTLSENLAPIFGFQSHTWDRIARGTRYVQGSFAINFKEVGYLQTAIKRLTSDLKADMTDNSSGFADKEFWSKNKTKPLEVVMSQDKDAGIGSYYKMVDALESSFWGEGNVADQTKLRSKTTYFSPVYPGVNQKGNEIAMRENGFNILVEFNDPTQENCATYDDKYSTHTTQSIIGVQLQSVGKQIVSGTQEVQEVYSFMAKDLDGYMPGGSLM